jgi:hypothetical protein
LYRYVVMSSITAREGQADVIVTHPNRDKPVVQATRATVVALLLVSAALTLVVTISGWNVLQGVVAIQIGYILVYLTFAYFATRWNRGVLPVAAALAVLLAIFALVAGPGWFDRDRAGFQSPDYLDANILGLLTLLIVPVQMLLVAFAMRGFSQGWNVELERRNPGAGAAAGPGAGRYPDAPPHPA